MKKNELAKKSRKLFSAILAGAMLTTSVIPESFVWAAEAEEVQGFGDSESMGFESTPDPVTGDDEDGEEQELSDFQGVADIQNGNAMMEMEEGFTDEIASFGSNGSDTPVESGFQSQASVEELQERINALPTVEEFQNLADGTTVEGSTLNQAQTDVYAEAQDIADKLDLLSEEELGLVDVSRLEALFGYFNGMTEVLETATKVIDPVTSGSVSITSGGTYTLNGGAYTTPDSAIIIDTEEPVTLNIAGPITASTAYNSKDKLRTPFINIKKNCRKLEINNDGNFKVELNNDSVSLLKDSSKGGVNQIIFTGGIYTASTDKASMIYFQGTIEFQNAVFKATGSTGDCGHIATSTGTSTGTVKIHSGTLIDAENSRRLERQVACISAENVQMDGGTITGPGKNGTIGGIRAAKVQFTGGVIENWAEAIQYNHWNQKEGIKIGGNATFKNNYSDIHLLKDQVFTIQGDFKGNASVYSVDSNPSFPRRITTSGISKSMLGRITSVNGYSVNYAEDGNGGYLYLWKHTHKWNYSSNGNKIIAKCSGSGCGNELELSLTAEDSIYYGEAYNGATVENNVSYVTGKPADIVYYLEGGTKETNAENSGAASEGAAPVNVGNYVIKVSVEDQTLSSAFKIEKAQVTPNVILGAWEYGQSENTPQVTVESGENDITKLYNKSQIAYTYYTDVNCTNVTTTANGAATNGGVPENAGTYYVKATVPEIENYKTGSAVVPFTINKLAAELTWGNTDLTYTGTEQSVSATVTNAVSGDTFNIIYEGNTQTEAGDSYTATVTGLGNDNYTLTGATGISKKWSISYLQTQNKAEPSGEKGNGDWFVSAVKLVPDSGYQISADKTEWTDSLGDYVTQGQNTVEYYLKEIATGSVTDKKTTTFKIDTEMPTGEIKIGENKFNSSPNPVTYGYWFRDNAAVDITGADSTSGIASIEYQKVRADEPYDVNGTWVTWDAANKLFLTESGKYVIYARITDMAGNQTIINSDGVVVFKDSVVVDSSIGYTRTTKASVDAEVTLNGNTVASVKNGENTLTAGTDYTVSADKITFSGEYLDTLAVGAYTLTVAYHPQGVTEYKGGDKPADSQIAVNVKRRTANIKITSVLDKEYDGQPADLAYTTNSNANVNVEYNVNGTWQTGAPIHAGTYEVKVSVPENGDFTAASDTKTYTIKQREVVISGITANAKVYDGNANAELDYRKAVFTGLVEGDTLTVSAEGTFADRNAAKGKTVTITNLVLGGVSADNYVLAANGQQTSTTADINPKEITVTITPNGGIYEGIITPATAKLNGLVGKDDPAIILTYTGTANDGTLADGKVPSKAGTYTVTASINDSNYSLKEEGSSVKFIVEKAYPQLSISAVTDKNYGEEAFKLGVSNKGDGSKSYASSNDKVVKVDENGTVTIVGAGTATLTVSLAECANYTKDQKEVTVTVKKINHSLVVTKLTYEVTYGDPVFKIAANAEDTESGIHFTSDNENVATVSADGTVTIKNAGTAKITVSMDESQNFLAVSKEVVVTVAPKEITVTPDNASKVYGESDKEFTYMPSGPVGEDTLSDITLSRAEGENVGTYEITAAQKKGANPNYNVKFNKGTFTINPKEITVTITPNGGTYEGTIIPAAAALNGLVGEDKPEITLTYTGKANNGTEVNGTEIPVLAGTYTVTASITDSNYRLKAEGTTAEFTVAKASPGLSVSAVADRNYGGEAFKLEVSHKGDGVKAYTSSNDKIVKVDETGTVTIVGAGTVTLTVSLAGTANYTNDQKEVTITVKKINHSFEVEKIDYEVTYGDPAFKIVANVGDTESGIRFTSDNENVATVSADGTVTIKNAGTAKITVSMDESQNYLAVSKEVVVTVAPKEVTVTPGNASKIYGEKDGKLSYHAEGLADGDSLSDITLTRTEGENVGIYEITAAQKKGANPNYNVKFNRGTFTISPKEITVTITPNGGTYEGAIIPANVALNGLVGEDKPEITLTYTGKANDGTEVNGTEIPALAGTYTVTASITDSNYRLKAEGTTAEFTVAKASPGLSVSAVADRNYGGEAFKLEVSHKGDGVKTYTSSNDKIVKVDETGTVTIVGAGTATLTVSLAETANYKSDQKEVTVTVKKINHSFVVDRIDYEVTYGDSAFKIAANAGDTESDIYFTSDNENVATVSEDGTVTIKNAGTAKITVSMDESQNYTAVSKEVIVTVAPKAITVTADNLKKIVGGADPVLTYTADGLVGEDTLSGITVKRKAGEKVGTYAVTVSQKAGANPNYRITFKKGTFTIQQADQSKLKGKDVYRLKLPVFLAKGKAKKNSIVLSWKKYTGATGYDVYWRYCDGSINYKKVGTVKNGKLSITHKKLKKDREYKYFIAAYKMVEGRKIYIAKSNGVHVAMKKAATTNAASIKVNKTKVTLSVGKTFELKCRIKSENSRKDLISHTSFYRYYTTNSKVATVSKAGVIKAKGKGTCSIYVLANNGVYKKVKVKVK